MGGLLYMHEIEKQKNYGKRDELKVWEIKNFGINFTFYFLHVCQSSVATNHPCMVQTAFSSIFGCGLLYMHEIEKQKTLWKKR